MAWTPLLLPELDAVSAERFCSLVDERATVAAELTRGVVLTEPIVSPKAEVVGTRVVANPAAAMLRQIDKALDALADRLGLVPAARSRMGVQLTTAERQALEVANLLDARFKPIEAP